MADEPESEALQAALDNNIQGAFQHTDRGMVTKWVLIAEVIDGDGDRAVWMMAPPGTKAWETLGMLEFARQVELSATINGENDD